MDIEQLRNCECLKMETFLTYAPNEFKDFFMRGMSVESEGYKNGANIHFICYDKKKGTYHTAVLTDYVGPIVVNDILIGLPNRDVAVMDLVLRMAAE